jgi:hypothetical protein
VKARKLSISPDDPLFIGVVGETITKVATRSSDARHDFMMPSNVVGEFAAKQSK